VQPWCAKLKPYEKNGARGPKETQNMVCKLMRNKNNIYVGLFLNDVFLNECTRIKTKCVREDGTITSICAY